MPNKCTYMIQFWRQDHHMAIRRTENFTLYEIDPSSRKMRFLGKTYNGKLVLEKTPYKWVKKNRVIYQKTFNTKQEMIDDVFVDAI